ncbi:MAG TPA: GAF domain-containing protein [Candidatus Angelobacter sp.]|jgi:GAF domain-containing protein
MIPQAPGRQLDPAVLEELQDIPLKFGLDSALARIAQLGHELMQSVVCSITMLDLEQRHFVAVASAGIPAESQRRIREKQFPLGNHEKGEDFDLDLISRGQVIRKYGLDQDGQGVAKTEACKRRGIHSLLAVPLRAGERLLGYMNHFSTQQEPFSPSHEECFQKFTEAAARAIEKMEEKAFSLERVAAMAIESESLDTFLAELVKLTPVLISAELCVVRLLDKSRNVFVAEFVSPSTTNGASQKPESIPAAQLGTFLSEHHWQEMPIRHRLGQFEKHLATPLRVYGQPVAILEVAGPITANEFLGNYILKQLANHASAAIKNLGEKKALKHVNTTLGGIAKAQTKAEVMNILMDGAFTLLGSKYGCISLLNYQKGRLDTYRLDDHRSTGDPIQGGDTDAEEGITGLALHKYEPIRLGDVSQHKRFIPYWPDSKSELAIPMYVKAATVRDETKLGVQRRPIGVLNVESPAPNAYSEFDEQCLVTLASNAAVVLDRLEFDAKLMALNKAESELASMVLRREDWDRLVQRVSHEITQTLGYSHVNLSLLSLDGTRIKSEHVDGTWLTPEQAVEFKQVADHELRGGDIQAIVAKKKQIVVPGRHHPKDDHRFDAKIHWRFRMHELALVYIPMVLNGVVVGTLEAGYPTRYQNRIYERDIQVLQSFVDYVTTAIGHRRHGLVTQLKHDFDMAIHGIQSNTDFLMQNLTHLGEDKIDRKFNDILADCSVLQRQAGNLGFYLGGEKPQPQPGMTAIGRDVIVKTINQLEPELRRYGWKRSAIEYDYFELADVRAYVDKSQICEVIANLFINALKYYDTADVLRLKVLSLDAGDSYILKIQDWGIGVQQGMEEKVFEEGFRTPEAVKRVLGTGLGLAISRQLMRQMGGDIRLSNNRKPTEFEVRLPKRAKMRRDDDLVR